jgi:hypothetical protein
MTRDNGASLLVAFAVGCVIVALVVAVSVVALALLDWWVA